MRQSGDPGKGRTAFLAVARAVNALFFTVTATYCVLTYNSFAYQQFIRPHLVAALASFVVSHHLWHWVMLGLTALTLLPELRHGRGRVLAWIYLASMTIAGIVMFVRPILPAVENDALGLWLACAFLVPPLWLAAYDHVATSPRVDPAPVDERRILTAAVGAGGLVWAMHAAAVPFRFKDLGDLTISRSGLAFGLATSLLVHVGVFAAAGLLMIVVVRGASRARDRGTAEYWLIAAASALAVFLAVERLVFASLSFRGVASWMLAADLALALTATWSGVARRLAAARPEPVSAIEAWCGPLPGIANRWVALTVLAALPALAFAAVERVSTFDWDFLVQHLCVLGVWLLACGYLHALVRVRRQAVRLGPIAIAAGALFVFAGARGDIESGLSAGLTRPAFVPEFVLDGYAAVDPSYRLLRHLLSVEPAGSAEFYGYLRANSLIERVPVAPIDVDFAVPLAKAPGVPPHVFLFVVDSLRRDYLSVYNPAVTFTPAIAKFAAESDAFTRAFTRYGGTGLSMPSIWAGGMLLHKEYVLPFQPMNALEKLLGANGYRMLISMDHITAQLIDEADPIEELDRGRDEMQYDLCRTLGEIESTLGAGATPPVFAHTRSLNLHVSKLTNRSLSLDRAYDGFQGPAAAAVGRMDRCFGTFIDFLKDRRLYDNSIVILTSDHGDSLGEAKRWGHSYTVFPEILRTPLIVHVPPAVRARFAADLDAPSFSTDITPTLYALLGYEPRALGRPYGAPLFVRPGTDQSWRRRETFLVASSYGPVYGLLERNGEVLYIADGVNARDYAYDISDLRPVRIGVTADQRAAGRDAIRDRIAEIAAVYRFTPEP